MLKNEVKKISKVTRGLSFFICVQVYVVKQILRVII